MTIIGRILDSIASAGIRLALKLSLICYRRAQAAHWRRCKLQALDQRRRF